MFAKGPGLGCSDPYDEKVDGWTRGRQPDEEEHVASPYQIRARLYHRLVGSYGGHGFVPFGADSAAMDALVEEVEDMLKTEVSAALVRAREAVA